MKFIPILQIKMVADFIGLVNFLPGSITDGRVHIAGMATLPNNSNLTGDVTIAVRPKTLPCPLKRALCRVC